MRVKIKKLHENAVMPYKAHATDAGFDLVATSRTFDEDGNVVYGTGLAFEIPEGYVGLLFPRSSNAKKDLSLTNSVGVLDSCYRGEVIFKFKASLCYKHTNYGWQHDADCYSVESNRESFINAKDAPKMYAVGDRIGQLIIMPLLDVGFEFADELSDSERGMGGYGSSGR